MKYPYKPSFGFYSRLNIGVCERKAQCLPQTIIKSNYVLFAEIAFEIILHFMTLVKSFNAQGNVSWS